MAHTDTADFAPLEARQAWMLWSPTLLFLALGLMALTFDVQIARFLLNDSPSVAKALGGVLKHFEAFAHGINVYTLFLVCLVMDPRHRWAMPHFLAMLVVPAVVAALLKFVIVRERPRVAELGGTVWETFHGFVPLHGLGNNMQSCPSSHTSNAVTLAIALAWLYPRGRWLFAVLAALGASQRLVTGAHFLSDIFFGAALGWFLAVGIMKLGKNA